MSIDQVLETIDANMAAAQKRLFELLKIPSISTDPAHAADCAKAAGWLASDLTALGFDVQVHPTNGHPMVVAHHKGSGPHMLFYGHYDVQPVDPLPLWNSPPFQPQIEKGDLGDVIRARGSSDDKGQLMTFIEALPRLESGAWDPARHPDPVFLRGRRNQAPPPFSRL